MQLILLACAVGAIGGIMEFWRPDMAHWFNIAGIALFLAGVLRWLTGGKRSARNWKSDSDIALPPSDSDGSSLGGGSCGAGESGCDGGGGDGGGGD